MVRRRMNRRRWRRRRRRTRTSIIARSILTPLRCLLEALWKPLWAVLGVSWWSRQLFLGALETSGGLLGLLSVCSNDARYFEPYPGIQAPWL